MSPTLFNDKIAAFSALLEQHQVEEYADSYSKTPSGFISAACKVHVHHARKYVRVDVGTSGKYMIERDTEKIFGIKAYGVIHRGHQYGTLDTIQDWQWGGYFARPVSQPAPQPEVIILSETKHTQGPWKVDESGSMIENLAGDFDKPTARLIAAAPELLAACQAALTRQDWPVGTNKIRKQLELAINKATNL